MSAFTPKDSKAEWVKVYDLIREGKPGQTFTFAQLDTAIGRDFRSNRGPMSRAAKELETVENLIVVAVRGKGYRIIERGDEYLTVGESRHRRSRRALVRASDATNAGIRSDLPNTAERGNLMLASARIARLIQAMGAKLVEHEGRILDQEQLTADHEERLRRLEQGERLQRK